MWIIVLMLLLQPTTPPKQKDKDGWYLTRDGRRIGKDCNPCAEGPEPGYVAPVIPEKDRHTMAGVCSPKGADGKSIPDPKLCGVKK
jgi:hypothetical protein